MRTPWLLSVVILFLIPSGAARAENVDPAGDGSQYAWGENAGWVNAEPSGNAGPGVDVQDFKLTGWMWAENRGWISLSCENTASCGTTSYGVTNDGSGTLSGYAWAENAGWIHFNPSGGGVTIDPTTGNFSGRAWGENIGWLIFADAAPVAYKVKTAWCQDVPSPPGGAPILWLEKAGGNSVLIWSVHLDSDWTDVVRGNLNTLRSTGGNFTLATDACLGDNNTNGFVNFGGDPPVGQGFWFLVREANCKGPGSYDVAGVPQIGDRDAEIDAAPGACP
jgi:hypothetical protein